MDSNLSFKELAFLLLILLPIAFVAISCQNDSQRAAIQEKVEELDGTLIEATERIFTNGPFHWYEGGKHVDFWEFTFEKDGAVHTGWVKFGWGRSWIIDDKREE